MHPLTYFIRSECFEHWFNLCAAFAITGNKLLEWLRMGDVQATLTRHQEFSPQGWHRIIHVYFQRVTVGTDDLCGHQACGSATDDRNGFIHKMIIRSITAFLYAENMT